MGNNKLGRLAFVSFFVFTIVIVAVIAIYSQYSQQINDSSAASNSNKKTLYGAFFFYWHDCPQNNCDKTRMPFDAPAYEHKSTSTEWYRQEFADMKAAGLDMAIMVSWGSGHPGFTWFQDKTVLPRVTQALDALNNGLKIAYFDDTNSVVAEWNNANGRGYGIPTGNPSIPKMPLNDSKNWSYFYDLKIKMFFQQLPQKYWATHNGNSVGNGGRPLVIIYDAPRSFSNLEFADEMWTSIKASFKRDFGVEPFLIVDTTWVDSRFNPEYQKMEKVADGPTTWAGGIDDLNQVKKRVTLNGYTTAQVDPGFVCPKGSNLYAGCVERPRNTTYLSTITSGDAERMSSMFKSVAPGSDLVMIETWNELWEGSGINRNSRYPKTGGGYLPSDYYIKQLKQLIEDDKVLSTVKVNKSPISNLGGANCTRIVGWTCDPDNYLEPLVVDIYADAPFNQGGVYLTSVTANIERGDGVDAKCNGSSNHGFVFNIPQSLKDNKKHKLYFYVHNATTKVSEQMQEVLEINSCRP